jgi:hypothetical protein
MQTQIDSIERRMSDMEERQRAHLQLSEDVQRLAQTTADNTKEVVELMEAFRGAFTVLEFIGKAAVPVAWITGVIASVALMWAEFKGYRK